jgi:hypothetical protein
LYRLGQLGEAVEVGDPQASGISLDVWAWATNGNVPQETIDSELVKQKDRQHDAQGTAQVMLADARCLMKKGQIHNALEVLQRALQIVDMVAGDVQFPKITRPFEKCDRLAALFDRFLKAGCGVKDDAIEMQRLALSP